MSIIKFGYLETSSKESMELTFNLPDPVTASEMFSAFHKFFLAAGYQEGSFQDELTALVSEDIAKNMPMPPVEAKMGQAQPS